MCHGAKTFYGFQFILLLCGICMFMCSVACVLLYAKMCMCVHVYMVARGEHLFIFLVVFHVVF